VIGFEPDIDPSTQGALQAVTNGLPTIRGIIGAQTPVNTIWFPDGGSRGCATVETLSSGTKKYLGQGNYLFELNGAGMALVGTGMSLGTGRIIFTTFGNAVLSCNGADGAGIVASTGGTFYAISGSPSAAIIESVGLQVLAFDCREGTDHLPDQWWASALGDYTNWTPNITTQAANGRFLDSPGGVTAAKRISGGIIAYKKRSMYYGQYVGGDVIWQWSQVATNIGCIGVDAVCNAGGAHYFVGADDIYTYDGSSPRSIGMGIKRWFFADADPNHIHRVIAVHDRNDDHVYFWYSSIAQSGTTKDGWFDKAIVYNMLTGKWGIANGLYQDIMTYQQGTDTLSVVGFDATLPAPYSGYVVQNLTGACATASITTWSIGDDDAYSRLQLVRPRFVSDPTTATMTHYHKSGLGEAWQAGLTDTVTDHKCNFSYSDRYHRLKLDVTGDYELTDIIITEQTSNGRR
jgi:hypothetical protein